MTDSPTIPAWLNVDAVLSPEERESIHAAERAALDLLTAAVRLRERVLPIKELWLRAVWHAEGGGDGLVDVLAPATGYERMDEALVLASTVLLEAWDDGSEPTTEYTAKLLVGWADFIEEAKIR
jgi:hypothetical protein